jgi:hypothetical protein
LQAETASDILTKIVDFLLPAGWRYSAGDFCYQLFEELVGLLLA